MCLGPIGKNTGIKQKIIRWRNRKQKVMSLTPIKRYSSIRVGRNFRSLYTFRKHRKKFSRDIDFI